MPSKISWLRILSDGKRSFKRAWKTSTSIRPLPMKMLEPNISLIPVRGYGVVGGNAAVPAIIRANEVFAAEEMSVTTLGAKMP